MRGGRTTSSLELEGATRFSSAVRVGKSAGLFFASSR